MDSYDRLIGKTLFEMKFNYYDNALREYSKDNIWFQSYNQLKYGIEDTCQYSYLKKCEQNYLYEGLLHTMDPNKALSKLKKYFDEKDWNRINSQLVLFGRYHCKSKNPKCESCKLKEICKEKIPNKQEFFY